MTVTREGVRIKAIARDGRSSCVFTGKGKPMGGDKMAAGTVAAYAELAREDG